MGPNDVKKQSPAMSGVGNIGTTVADDASATGGMTPKVSEPVTETTVPTAPNAGMEPTMSVTPAADEPVAPVSDDQSMTAGTGMASTVGTTTGLTDEPTEEVAEKPVTGVSTGIPTAEEPEDTTGGSTTGGVPGKAI